MSLRVNFSHLAAIARRSQELHSAQMQSRMPQRRRNLRQRREHESSLRNSRVRNFELRCSHHGRTKKKNVDIDRPRRVANGFAPPSHFALDFLCRSQKLPRHQSRFAFHHAVQEPMLVPGSDRLGFVHRRSLYDSHADLRKQIQRPLDLCRSVAAIRSQRQVCDVAALFLLGPGFLRRRRSPALRSSRLELRQSQRSRACFPLLSYSGIRSHAA